MKYLAVALIAICAFAAVNAHVLNLSEEQRTRVRGFGKECLESEGVTKEAIKEVKKGNFANVDDKVKSFTLCLFEKIGFFANGVPQPEVVHTKLVPLVGEEKFNTIKEKCHGQKGDTPAETAWKFYQCYYEQNASYL